MNTTTAHVCSGRRSWHQFNSPWLAAAFAAALVAALVACSGSDSTVSGATGSSAGSSASGTGSGALGGSGSGGASGVSSGTVGDSGMTTSGTSASGTATSGATTSGMATAGMATSGIATSGMATTGMATTGMATSGKAHMDAGAGATFTEVYALIAKQCLPCHATGAGFKMGMLDMSSQTMAYSNLVGAMAMGTACKGKGTRVVASDSAMSILYAKITTPTCGTKMPHAPGMLTKADIALFKAWIDGGAPNN